MSTKGSLPSDGAPVSQRTFIGTHRVSYSECTVGNHVYHSRFLDILERVRGEFFRSLDHCLRDLQEQEVIFPVTACQMRFRSMARYDEVLTIELWVTHLGRARFSCAGRFTNAPGEVLFEAVTELGCTNLEGRPRRLPPALSEALRPYLAAPPVGQPQP